MNCFNHPNESAVAICPSCGRAMCPYCVSKGSTVCHDCKNIYLKAKVAIAIKYLVLLAVIGLVGYFWDFMGKPDMPDKGLSAYLLMSICTGAYFLIGKFSFGNKYILVFDSVSWSVFMLLGMLLKIFLALIIGVFLTPVIIGWQTIVIVRNGSLLFKNLDRTRA